jgi:hypothetical protein
MQAYTELYRGITLCITTLGITTHSLMTFNITTLSIAAFSITTLSIRAFSITIRICDTRHNATQHNDAEC